MLESKSCREVWQVIERGMSDNPEPNRGLNVIYQYGITGEESGTFQLVMEDGSARVMEGAMESAECILRLSDKNFKKMIAGKLNGTAAYMTGKLKVKGSLGLALKLEGIFNEYNMSETV